MRRMVMPKLQGKYCLVFVFLMIIQISTIQQKCSLHDSQDKNSLCPINSKCNQKGYCQCNQNYFGNCQNQGIPINDKPQSFKITENISYFIFNPKIHSYANYHIILNNQLTEKELLSNLWYDDGRMITPTEDNAYGKDKTLSNHAYSTNSGNPLSVFNSQLNGQDPIFILGIKLKNPGSTQIELSVYQNVMFGPDNSKKLVIGIIIIGIVMFGIIKYKKRVIKPLDKQKFDISHSDQYMPSISQTFQQSNREKQQESIDNMDKNNKF